MSAVLPMYAYRKLADYVIFNPLPDDKFSDSSKLREFADDNFKFDENGRKLSEQEENTVEGKITRYEQFLLFPVFSKGLFPRGVKRCHCVGMGKSPVVTLTSKALGL